MSVTTPDDKPTDKSSKTAFEISLGSAIVAIATQIDDEFLREFVSILGPPAGFGLSFLSRLAYRQYQSWRLVSIVRGWIRELQIELQRPDISPKRKREIEQEIADHRKMLQKHQLDNLDIK